MTAVVIVVSNIEQSRIQFFGMPINEKQRCTISIYKSLGASLSNKKVKLLSNIKVIENLSFYYFPGSDD